jgi:hydrogenase maturation factor
MPVTITVCNNGACRRDGDDALLEDAGKAVCVHAGMAMEKASSPKAKVMRMRDAPELPRGDSSTSSRF